LLTEHLQKFFKIQWDAILVKSECSNGGWTQTKGFTSQAIATPGFPVTSAGA